jgi:hypothetical protein
VIAFVLSDRMKFRKNLRFICNLTSFFFRCPYYLTNDYVLIKYVRMEHSDSGLMGIQYTQHVKLSLYISLSLLFSCCRVFSVYIDMF